MSVLHIGCVVEGLGDAKALPVLIRRIALRLDPADQVVVPDPIRWSRSKLLKLGELEKAVELAARKVGGSGGVLVVLDADDDCPAALGPALLARARSQRSHLPIGVVLAKFEFEAWFLAAASSLSGCKELHANLVAPPDPESVRDAKGWLTRHMPRSRPYVETKHQASLAQQFDLDQARSAPSFDKCFREITAVLGALKS